MPDTNRGDGAPRAPRSPRSATARGAGGHGASVSGAGKPRSEAPRGVRGSGGSRDRFGGAGEAGGRGGSGTGSGRTGSAGYRGASGGTAGYRGATGGTAGYRGATGGAGGYRGGAGGSYRGGAGGGAGGYRGGSGAGGDRGGPARPPAGRGAGGTRYRDAGSPGSRTARPRTTGTGRTPPAFKTVSPRDGGRATPNGGWDRPGPRRDGPAASLPRRPGRTTPRRPGRTTPRRPGRTTPRRPGCPPAVGRLRSRRLRPAPELGRAGRHNGTEPLAEQAPSAKVGFVHDCRPTAPATKKAPGRAHEAIRPWRPGSRGARPAWLGQGQAGAWRRPGRRPSGRPGAPRRREACSARGLDDGRVRPCPDPP